MVDGYAGDVCNFTVSGWTGTGILPIELISFTARNEGKQNLIEWATASESNNDYFTLEKSFNGIEFEKIGDVKSIGNSTKTNRYSSYDYTPSEEITYYRLKFTDVNSIFKYTKIISVDLSGLYNTISNLHPNPTNEDVHFDYYSKTTDVLNIEILDFSGNMISETIKSTEASKNDLSIDLEKFKSGVYLLKVTSQATGKTMIQKIIKN